MADRCETDGASAPVCTPTLERIVAAGAFCIAFAVMASVFQPERSTASPPAPVADAGSGIDRAAAVVRVDPSSANPHVGLELLGELRGESTIIRAYRAADVGVVRFSMYAADDGRLLVALRDAGDAKAIVGGDGVEGEAAAWIDALQPPDQH